VRPCAIALESKDYDRNPVGACRLAAPKTKGTRRSHNALRIRASLRFCLCHGGALCAVPATGMACDPPLHMVRRMHAHCLRRNGSGCGVCTATARPALQAFSLLPTVLLGECHGRPHGGAHRMRAGCGTHAARCAKAAFSVRTAATSERSRGPLPAHAIYIYMYIFFV
jgi:hypothetical protein